MTADESVTVILKGRTAGAGGGPIHKEFPIEEMTAVGDRFLLIDEDGEGRLMLSADELVEIGEGEL